MSHFFKKAEYKKQEEEKKPKTNIALTKNITLAKQYVMKTVGKVGESEVPTAYREENQKFKDIQMHYKNIEKLEKKISKHTEQLSNEEALLGDELFKFAATLSFIEAEDLQRVLLKFGRAIREIAQLRVELQAEMTTCFFEKVHSLFEEGSTCMEIKEAYRTARLNFDMSKHKLAQAQKVKNKKTGECDKEKLDRAQQEFKETQEILDKQYKATLNELEFQKRIRDQEYANSLRVLMVSYKKFFDSGAECLGRVSSELLIPQNQKKLEREKVLSIHTYNPHQQFDVELSEVMAREEEQGNKVPRIFQEMCKYVEDNGMRMVGIFRTSGQSPEITRLKKEYNAGNFIPLAKYKGVPEISGLLKLYLRELPSPLFPYALYNDILNICSLNESEQVKALQYFVASLPEPNLSMLDMLLDLLYKIAELSDENRMTPSNLAIVFGMNILRSEDKNPVNIIRDNQRMSTVTELLIKNYKKLKFDPNCKGDWVPPKIENTSLKGTTPEALLKSMYNKPKEQEVPPMPVIAKPNEQKPTTPPEPKIVPLKETVPTPPEKVAKKPPEPPKRTVSIVQKSLPPLPERKNSFTKPISLPIPPPRVVKPVAPKRQTDAKIKWQKEEKQPGSKQPESKQPEKQPESKQVVRQQSNPFEEFDKDFPMFSQGLEDPFAEQVFQPSAFDEMEKIPASRKDTTELDDEFKDL